MFSLYDEKGILPEGGNSMDMTYKFLIIFNIIRGIRDKHRKKAEKKARRK